MQRQQVKGRGPLVAYADGYATELARRGYSPSAVHLRLWQFHSLSAWLEAEDLTPAMVGSQDLKRFVVERRTRGMKSWISLRSLRLPVEYLREATVLAPGEEPARGGRVEQVLAGYHGYAVWRRRCAPTGGIPARTQASWLVVRQAVRITLSDDPPSP